MKKKKLKTSANIILGKVKFKMVIDTSQFDEWFAGLSEKEKTDYWNKECKKGESSL